MQIKTVETRTSKALLLVIMMGNLVALIAKSYKPIETIKPGM
jgi:hypothetical protein